MKSPFPKRESSRPYWTHIPPGFDPPDMPTSQEEVERWEQNCLEERAKDDMRAEMQPSLKELVEWYEQRKKLDAKL